ncbi:multidrug effflux MFS transporter [Williamsia sp.]|uniref:multidrug effflux MFS transporter n=1 Tax=Williamsia sp. TaxID=1872085 RepID=UPI002F936882
MQTTTTAALPGPMMIFVLAFMSAVSPFSTDMYLPAFPVMADEFGATTSQVQLTLTAFLIGLAFGQLVIGVLSDRFGRRIPMLVGAVACSIASAMCAIAPTIDFLTASRFAQGFAGSAGIVLARAVVSDRANGIAAARLFTAMMAIGSIAPVIGPVVGGLIVVGSGWRTVFWTLAAFNLVMMLGAVLFVPESLPKDRRQRSGARSLMASARGVLGNRHYVGYTLTLAFAFMVLFGFISASPFVLQNIMGLSTTAYSAAFATICASIAICSAVSMRLVAKYSPLQVLRGGVISLVGLTLALLLATTVGGVPRWPTLLLMLLIVGSLGFVFGNAIALASAQVRHAAGIGSAVLGATQFTFGAIASPLVGLGGDDAASPMGFTLFVAAVLSGLALFTTPRKAERHTA